MSQKAITLEVSYEIQRLSMTMNNIEIADYLDIPLEKVKNVFKKFPPLSPRRPSNIINAAFLDSLRQLMPIYSNAEIADKLGVSRGTVNRAISIHLLTRTPEQLSSIRSRIRKELIMAEKRRVLFGFDQKTNLKVFTNKEKNIIRNKLRRHRYKVFRHDNTIYYDNSTRRDETIEEKGKRVGLTFLPFSSYDNSITNS